VVCDRCLVDVGHLVEPTIRGVTTRIDGRRLEARVAAAFSYQDPVVALVLAAKNGGRFDLLAQLARWLPVFVDTDYDTVSWVPASREGRRRRGYDQGREMARILAKRLEVPLRSTLVRHGHRRQRGQSRQDRLQGPVFVARSSHAKRVLLVDDVFTTGGTIAAAARALMAHGSITVDATVVAAASHENG